MNRNQPNNRSEPTRATGPRRRSRRKSSSPYGAPQQQTSVPTSRLAYAETRQWLLAKHGPICAYCENRIDPGAITLDHVTPRRGQTAYDRRDNLVLACPTCNGQKKDTPILAFLLARRSRAVSLLRYGAHLSPMLVDLARQLAGSAAANAPVSDPDSPYRD
jgi:5-methylcytosine-specific restriction endonuclease McrA